MFRKGKRLTAPIHCSQLRGWENHTHESIMLTNCNNLNKKLQTLKDYAIIVKMIIRFLSASYLSCGHYGRKSQSTKSANCVGNKKLTNCCNLCNPIIKQTSMK
jgi:hypothetical protein